MQRETKGHNSLLFASPKQGGILQSSGFLDLESLIALSETCKANAFDELSLIQLIENEITRNHGVQTMEEAIAFWRNVNSGSSLLKRWLQRSDVSWSGTAATAATVDESTVVVVTRDMLLAAVRYDVALAKMLQQIPRTERSQVVDKIKLNGIPLLHRAAYSGNLESIKVILSLYPESQQLQVVDQKDRSGENVLLWATKSGNLECVKTILALYPEAQQLQMVSMYDRQGTVLHQAAVSGNAELLTYLLHLFPESQRLKVVSVRDADGENVLHWAVDPREVASVKAILHSLPISQRLEVVNSQTDRTQSTALMRAASSGAFDLVHTILDFLPESHRLSAVSLRDKNDATVLHWAAQFKEIETIKAILALYPESQHFQVMRMQDRTGRTIFHYVALLDDFEAIKALLSLLPESQRVKAANMQNRNGHTVLQVIPSSVTRDAVMELLHGSRNPDVHADHLHSSSQENNVDVEQRETKRQRLEEAGRRSGRLT